MPRRVAHLLLLLALSWLVMTVTHELGHVAAGWLGGATLTDLHLLGLPYSRHDPNPRPALTVAGGPILGVLLPLLAALALRQAPTTVRRSAWFVADFCVLANGVYLALAWVWHDPTLDTARLLDAGVPPIAIALFCVVCIATGYPRFRRDIAATWTAGETATHHTS